LDRCQNGAEKSIDTDSGMETSMQSCEGGSYGEVVYFLRSKPEGTADDHQWLKRYDAGKWEGGWSCRLSSDQSRVRKEMLREFAVGCVLR
jgi:hypothetical protein